MRISDLFPDYVDYIYKVCRYETKTEHAAMDLAHDVILKLLRRSHFEITSPCQYIQMCVHNAKVNWTRKNRPFSLSAKDELTMHYELEDTCVRKEREKIIRASVEKLPELYRCVVKLFYFSGLGVKEIGEKLGIPKGTIQRRLFDARNMLKKELAQLA